MPDEQLEIGDDAVHGEEAYALWGDGEKYDPTRHGTQQTGNSAVSPYVNGARGVTINLWVNERLAVLVLWVSSDALFTHV